MTVANEALTTNILPFEATRPLVPNSPAGWETYKRDLYQRFSGKYGNAVNFFISAAEKGLETSLKENILTTAIEVPFSHLKGEYSYQLDWNKHSDGELSLGQGKSDLGAILQESVANTSGQIPEFEVARNRYDLAFYDDLRSKRAKDDRSTHVFFSPSPSNVSDEELRSRNYQGFDYVAFYDLDPNGKEKVSQYFLPKQDRLIYQDLISQLGLQLPQDLQTDHALMSLSGALAPDQVNKVRQFVELSRNKGLNRLETMDGEIRSDYLKRISDEIFPLLGQFLDMGYSMAGADRFTESLVSQVYSRLNTMQYELTLRLAAINNKDKESRARYHSFINMDKQQQQQQATINHVLAACGIGSKGGGASVAMSTKMSIWGRGSALIDSADPFLKDEGKCDNCGQTWKIDLKRPNATYRTRCPNPMCDPNGIRNMACRETKKTANLPLAA